MEVVYVFVESAAIRVPFFNYDQHQFGQLLAQGGAWDRVRQEFVFRRNTSPEYFSWILPGVPCVWVDNEAHLLLPKKFPEHWQVKLETELRSRKYSPRTQGLYLYFNRLLCNMLQKTPEEICPEDVTQFLATIEKNKNYSAS